MTPLCHDVTHAFFASYVHVADFTKLADYNAPLFRNFLVAIDTVANKSLQRVCVQTGGKVRLVPECMKLPVFWSIGKAINDCRQHYGMHLGPVEVPLHEGMTRYDDRGENFYYQQEDFLFDLAAKRSWDWNIIRPHAIIGFTPAGTDDL